MKKVLSVIMCLSFLLCLCGCGTKEESSKKAATTVSSQKNGGLYYENSNVSSTNSSKVAESKSGTDYSSASVPPSDIKNPTGIYSADRKDNSGDNWNLTLANPWNTLAKNYSVELSDIDSRFADGKQFDSRAVKYLNEMCSAALSDGLTLTVISAYRSYDYQKMLFDNEVAECKQANATLSDEAAKKQAATVVARPGTSEHSLGLAVDIDSVEESFENTAAFSWLQKHCTEYGFIMRYSKEKQEITGVIYEPWHYRYVGKGLAKKIADSGLCLEEYLKNN